MKSRNLPKRVIPTYLQKNNEFLRIHMNFFDGAAVFYLHANFLYMIRFLYMI